MNQVNFFARRTDVPERPKERKPSSRPLRAQPRVKTLCCPIQRSTHAKQTTLSGRKQSLSPLSTDVNQTKESADYSAKPVHDEDHSSGLSLKRLATNISDLGKKTKEHMDTLVSNMGIKEIHSVAQKLDENLERPPKHQRVAYQKESTSTGVKSSTWEDHQHCGKSCQIKKISGTSRPGSCSCETCCDCNMDCSSTSRVRDQRENRSTTTSSRDLQLSVISPDNPPGSSNISDEAIVDEDCQDDSEVELLLQPQTKPITLEQLDVEIRTIYAGVVSFEDRCICADKDELRLTNDSPALRKPKSIADYQSYIALHKALIHEHHDLCLATQHPVASDELRELPRKLSVPARMWRHAIHAPLEVLRARLPESREHMIAFILIAFNMVTLFLETVPMFEGSFVECIGDLSRYRLALAENDEERRIFSDIARYWYNRAIDLNPLAGRLLHHQAILAPPYSVEQLSLYGRALINNEPFPSARKSILSLLRPVYRNPEELSTKIPPALFRFLRAHAALYFGGKQARDVFENSVDGLTSGLFGGFIDDNATRKISIRKLVAYMAFANLAALFEYGATVGNGASRSILRLAFLQQRLGDNRGAVGKLGHTVERPGLGINLSRHDSEASKLTIRLAAGMAFSMLDDALQRPKNVDLHPLVHIMFVLILSAIPTPAALTELESYVPWDRMAHFLDFYANPVTMTCQVCRHEFPDFSNDIKRPLPEDWMLRGSPIAAEYLPDGWCQRPALDEQERMLESHEVVAPRIKRILWIGWRIADYGKWLVYQESTMDFAAGGFPSIPIPGPVGIDMEPLFPADCAGPQGVESYQDQGRET